MLDQNGVRPEALIALVSAAISIGYPAGAMVYSRIAHRVPEPVIFAAGCLMTGVGLIGVGVCRAWPMIAVLGFVQQLGGGFMLTLTMHQGQERFAFKHRARVMGVWTSAFFAGQFASPLVVNAAGAAIGGLRPAVTLMGALVLLAGVILAGFLGAARAGRRPIILTPGA